MALEGTFNITSQTPLGESKGVLIVKTEGDKLVGTMEGQELYETSINGNEFTYKVNLKGPVGKMKLTFSGTIDGDKISGESKNMFGVAPFVGIRA